MKDQASTGGSIRKSVPSGRAPRQLDRPTQFRQRDGDNLALQRAVREAPSGSILVVEAGGLDFGYWGGILTEIALLRGLSGLVINGTVRDIDEIELLQFPVFATGIAMRHAGKKDPGTIGESISLAGRPVITGDIVVADTDGVVIVPQASAATALTNAEARAEKERLRIETIRSGEVPPDDFRSHFVLGSETPDRCRVAALQEQRRGTRPASRSSSGRYKPDRPGKSAKHSPLFMPACSCRSRHAVPARRPGTSNAVAAPRQLNQHAPSESLTVRSKP